jgi:hypothetical protein
VSRRQRRQRDPGHHPGLVSATALDGGTGADVDPLWHGSIDAAIAGGSGYGVLGAWPQLKIVSVRATDIPSPGQKPTFQFDDYVRGIIKCSEDIPSVQVAAIALPLSSVIAPTPDQEQEFAGAVAQAQSKGISILAPATSPGRRSWPAVSRGSSGSVPATAGPSRARLARRRA